MAHYISTYDQYIATLKAQRIFDPAKHVDSLLPHHPYMTVAETLQQINKLKSWLDSFRPFPPTVIAELKKLYDVRFTYHSNAIEGNTLTQSETEMILEKGITVGGKTLKEHLEVIGHKEAIDYVEELARKDAPIGEREIKDLHSLIMRDIDRDEAGRYRRLDVRAAGTEHIYPPHFQLSELMEGFAEWLHSETAKRLHPVEYAAEAHYRLASVHPFRDGNGRTARLLMNLLLIRRGYPVAVITNERRKEYIDSLAYAQANNDEIGGLINLVAEASRESIIEHLRILSTAYESKGKGLPFYREMLALLKEWASEA